MLFFIYLGEPALKGEIHSMVSHSLNSLPSSSNLLCKSPLCVTQTPTTELPVQPHSHIHMRVVQQTHRQAGCFPLCHSSEIPPGLCSTELTPELASPAHYCLNWTNLISSLPVVNLWQKVPALRGHVGSTETQKSQSDCSDRNSGPRDPAQSAANTQQLTTINHKHTTIDWHQPGTRGSRMARSIRESPQLNTINCSECRHNSTISLNHHNYL